MNTKHKIISLEKAQNQIKTWQKEGKEVVFTNGCFDILHLGHIDYLEKAQLLGNKLVVGLNTDDSVKRLKGNSRPINEAYARSRLLAALAFVDAVVLFDQDTPLHLIEALKPSILVKGNDYSIETIVGADVVIRNGGRVCTIPLVDGYSTTTILQKMNT